jgi:Fe-S cluster biogenesis protein NfuA
LPPVTPVPTPAPQSEAIEFDDDRPKIRKIVHAPVVVEADASAPAQGNGVRIKAQVDRDGSTCKFMMNRSVFPGYSAWFPGTEWTKDASPLAEKLFAVEGVGSVLLHDTTLTLGRAEGNARGWKDIATEAGKVIREQIESGEPSVTDALQEGMPDEAEVREKIQKVIDLEINPGIASHSGVVSLERVEGNTVYITMGGGCQGCAASTITLRHGIHTAFRKAMPAVGAIYDETDHAAGINPYFTELPAGMST